jgi:Flp pilus assembly protein protease CpaA
MNLYLEILFITTLTMLFYQDIKERKISVWFLIAGLFLGGILHFLQQNQKVFIASILMNISFIALIFGVLCLYAKIILRNNIFEVFGMGDLLFFILLAVSLPILSFLVVFIFSLFFSLLVFILVKRRLNNKTVPLAGLQSLFLILVLLANKLFPKIELYTI